ncbi:hypothetical protein V6N13_111215 [Hibiscus sabdariffa]|uniref:Enoyl reductase (ER) domain-containing protein n=1 Tax=Hibiscus sabdariffa TaxID=183260 RepID=A0ABR2TJI7_9ROSI
MSTTVEEQKQQKAFGWAATDQSGTLSPFNFSRRENGDEDVTLKILYCGVCHSDLHVLKNEWGFTSYPVVPGHEIVGVATKVGKNVTNFKVGDRVGVGVFVGSCKTCECCQQDLENYCPQIIFTFNSYNPDGTKTYGGYSDMIVVDQRYVLRFPDNLPLDAGAPLLCAGITVYSSMKYYGMTEAGKHLGVAGLGGLGHVAVKIAKAFGLKVTVISSSPDKESEAINRLEADSFLLSSDPAKMKSAIGSMDYIIDTVSAAHPLLPLLSVLKVNGKLVTVGLPNKPLELPVFPLVFGRKLVGGSDVGGMKETQEMLDFCAKHNIAADIELIRMDEINTAMERLAKSDVRYRFVIDVGNSLSHQLMSLEANDQTTSGFTQVSLSQSNFELQRPYDKSPRERYSFNNGVHRLWVYSTDKPHTPTSHTEPRTEIRIRGYDYSSGVWQFEGEAYIPRGTTGATVMQIFGGSSRATTIMLQVYDGELAAYRRSERLLSNMYNRWFKVNVIHDVGASNVKVYIDGVLRYEGSGAGGHYHYFKFGVYAADGPSHRMESRWRGIRVLTKN